MTTKDCFACRSQSSSIRSSTARSSDSNYTHLRSSKRQQIFPFPLPEEAPPACEAIQTNILWRRVLRAKEMPQVTRPRYAKQTSSSTARSLTYSAESSTPALTASTSVKTKSPRLTERTFRQDVFQRYGINVTQTASVWSPYEHFGTADPVEEGYTESMQDWYQREHKHSSIWLEYDEAEAERVAGQYSNLIAARAREAKLSFRGKNYFFKEDDVFAHNDDARCSSTYFELEWAPNPDGNHLRCPPPLDGLEPNFSFNTNPDCMYWLTTRRMNREYSDSINMFTYVLLGPEVTAPYLTIEFKKDDTSFEAAENQLAVSSTLSLYNRFRLRCSRLQAYNRVGDEQAFSDIEHYGIAFNGSSASFYVAKPILSFDETHDQLEKIWKGCNLVKFAQKDARTSKGVIQIKQWVNEIHNWGLGKHSNQFIIDIKGLLVKSNGRGRISLLPEEMEALGID